MRIHNSDLIREIIDGAKLQSNQGVPQELDNKVIPVMEVNPALLPKGNILVSLAGTATLSATTAYATLANKRTFVTGASMAFSKDATNDTSTAAWTLTLTPKGKTARVFCGIGKLTLTTEHDSVSVDFPPIEVEPGTNITRSSFTFTAGTADYVYIIYGYEIELSGA